VLLGAGKLEAGRLGAGAWWEAEGWTLEKLEAWSWRLGLEAAAGRRIRFQHCALLSVLACHQSI